MGIIFCLSHQSGDTLSPYLPAFPGSDKICHMTIYGLLALTVLWSFYPGRQGTLVKVALKTVVFCLVYGMTDEFHQSFIPQRSVSGLDLSADLVGAMLVCGIWLRSKSLRVFLESWDMTLVKWLKGDYIEKRFKDKSF
jgi:VanZ family protein